MKNFACDYIFLFKTKPVPVLDKTTYRELEVPIIRSLRNRIDSVEWSTHIPSALPPLKILRCPMKMSLGGPKSFSGRCAQEEAPFVPASIRAPDRPVRSYAQYRLHYTSEIPLNGAVLWWRIIMFTSWLQDVSTTVSWCCMLLLPSQFDQTAVFIGIQME